MSKYLKKYQKAGSVVPLKDYVFNGPLKGKCVGEGCLEIATNLFNKVTGANKYDYFPMQDSWFFRSAALKNGDQVIYDPGKGKTLPKREKGGLQDMLGYKDISPYRFRPYNLINSGNITMDGVSTPLLAVNDNQVHYLPPNSGNYNFKGDKTLEIPLYATGGMWGELEQIQELQDEQNPQNQIDPVTPIPKPPRTPIDFSFTGKTPATTPFFNTVNKLQREDMVNSMSLQPKQDLKFDPEKAINNGPKLEKIDPETSELNPKNREDNNQDKNDQNSWRPIPPVSSIFSGLSEGIVGLQQLALGASRKVEEYRKRKDIQKKLADSEFNPTFSYAENDYGTEYKKGGLVKYPDGGEQDEENFDAYDFLFNDSNQEIDETIEQNNTQIEENALEEATKEAQEENDREQANLLDEVMSWKKGNMEGEEPTIYPNFSSKRSMRRANDGGYGELNLASGRVQPLSLSDNKIAQALQYRNYAMSLGLSKQEASGLIGNAIAESGLNPTILGTADNKGSRGLFQPHSSRLDALKQRAQNMKADWRNPFMQINQAVHELNTTHKKARGNFYTATQASDAIMNHFEKPSKAAKAQSRNKRAGYAEMLMQFQKGGTYNLSHKEIKDLINKGYKIEVV